MFLIKLNIFLKLMELRMMKQFILKALDNKLMIKKERGRWLGSIPTGQRLKAHYLFNRRQPPNWLKWSMFRIAYHSTWKGYSPWTGWSLAHYSQISHPS